MAQVLTMVQMRKLLRTLAALLFCLCAVACVTPFDFTDKVPAEIVASLDNLPETSSQVLLISAEDPAGFKAKLYVLEKHDGLWRNAFSPLPALIGGEGMAPLGKKREGDRRTPSGVFSLQRAFGYAPQVETRIPYRQAGDEDVWVDDPAAGDYNRWVHKGETSAASFEELKRDDDCYKYGIVVEYNTDPVVRGAGSAIFIHVRGGKNQPTMGCVALSERDMLKVLRWLDPAAKPLAVLGTKDSLFLVTKGAGVVIGEDGGRS